MFEQCIYFNLNALVRDLNKIWEAQFADIELSPPLGYMFSVILEQPGISPRELSQVLHLERSTVTRFVDTLEGKGLIRREAAAEDARGLKLVPTAKGQALKPKLMKVMRKLGGALGGKVQDNEVASMLKMTARMRENLRDG